MLRSPSTLTTPMASLRSIYIARANSVESSFGMMYVVCFKFPFPPFVTSIEHRLQLESAAAISMVMQTLSVLDCDFPELCCVLAAGAAGTRAAVAFYKKQLDTAVCCRQQAFYRLVDQTYERWQRQQAVKQAKQGFDDCRQQAAKQTSDEDREAKRKQGIETLEEALLDYSPQPGSIHEDFLQQSLQIYEDFVRQSDKLHKDVRDAISSSSRGTSLALITMPGLCVAGLLAWVPACIPKCSSYRRFMVQHFMQRLPSARAAPVPTAPHTLLTSALGPVVNGSRIHWQYASEFGALLGVTLSGCCIQFADRMGPFNSLAFYLSAATVSSLAGESLAHKCPIDCQLLK